MSQYTRVTDRRTDRILIARPRLHCMQRGKKQTDGVYEPIPEHTHVNQLTARCYSSLRRIKSCRRALSRTASVTLINSLIVSRLSHQLPLVSLSTLQLVETSSSLAPDFVLATGHSPSLVLWCGTVCPPTFDLHQHSAPSRIGSRLNCFYSRIL